MNACRRAPVTGTPGVTNTLLILGPRVRRAAGPIILQSFGDLKTETTHRALTAHARLVPAPGNA